MQYHNADLGVYLQNDTQIIPIGPSDLHKHIDVPNVDAKADDQLSEAVAEDL